VFIASENRIYTLLADTGEQELWNPLETPIDAGPALVNNYAIFGGTSGRVFAQDVIAGASRWEYQLTSGVLVRPVPAAPNNVVVADGGGVYAMLDGTSGKLVWRGRTFGSISARPAVTAGTVYVPSEDQTLYAVLRATGTDRWKYRAAVPLTENPVALGNSVYLPIPNREMLALDPDTGKQLWRLPGSPQPLLLAENRLLVSSGRVLGWVDNRNGTSLGGARTEQLQRVLVGPGNSLILVSASGRLQRLDPAK
jgi:eukaryotic-like serine/threonine-protein kinase